MSNGNATFNVSTGLCSISSPEGSIGRIGIPKVEKKIISIKVNGNLVWNGTYHLVSGIGKANEDADFFI